jgi:predicted Zn-dependent protease
MRSFSKALCLGFILVTVGSVHAINFGDILKNKDKIVSGFKIGKKAIEASKDIEPEQEYTVGRNIAAQVMYTYPPIEDQEKIRKVNLIGQALVLKSTKPDTFNGYSFMVLDQDDPNGFATPGGHVFVTKGMLDLCETDSHIAAILSHEIGHVAAGHGTEIIKKMRKTDLALTAGQEVAKNSGKGEVAALSGIAKGLLEKVMEKGFGREQELEADGLGALNLKAAGFDPEAIIEMLEKIEAKYGKLDIALFKSHPRPEIRIAHVKKVIETGDPNAKLTHSEKKEAVVAESKVEEVSKVEEEPKKKKGFGFGNFFKKK